MTVCAIRKATPVSISSSAFFIISKKSACNLPVCSFSVIRKDIEDRKNEDLGKGEKGITRGGRRWGSAYSHIRQRTCKLFEACAIIKY